MSKCQDIRGGLDDWLDGIADGHLQAAIDAHLAECDACARLFRRHQDIGSELNALAQAANNMADTVEHGRTMPSPSRWRPLLRIAAAVLVVAGVGLSLTKPWQREQGRQYADGTRQSDAVTEQPAGPVFHITVPDNRLAVPIESSNPRIHIVWLYDEMSPPDAAPGDDAGDPSASPS